jgi:hypothetical protein
LLRPVNADLLGGKPSSRLLANRHRYLRRSKQHELRRNQMSTGMATYVMIAILTGALGAIHVPINGALGARIQSTAVATFTFHGVAFLISLVSPC